MDALQFYRARLPEFLDANGDLAPPWERFPSYERHTIGWRMGTGEGWLAMWHVFLEDFDPSFQTRIEYLRRHPPAPVKWADAVHRVLHPSTDDSDRDEDDKDATTRRDALQRGGLIASDVAYSTWLSQQRAVRWPWEDSESPQDAARYWTRDLWFWSRQVAGLRSNTAWESPTIPDRWQTCAPSLRTGEAASLDPRHGLLSLAQTLSAGRVMPPWLLGLTTSDFADSFDNDMGYVDAFRLWGMAAIDDREQLHSFLTANKASKEWTCWCEEHFLVD